LGLPVPDDLDGHVLLDLFVPVWRADHPLHFHRVEDTEVGPKAPHPYSVAEEALIADRLKGLGYLE
jgi:hypothetical protein